MANGAKLTELDKLNEKAARNSCFFITRQQAFSNVINKGGLKLFKKDFKRILFLDVD